MSEPNSMDDWQLQESPGASDQWQLLDKEQELPDNLQLQETSEAPSRWQPVAQGPEAERSGGSGWILPSLIIVALLAVLGYIGWLALNGFEIGVPASPPPATEAAADAEGEPGVVAVATQTEAPATATPLPATATAVSEPTPEPTLPTVVQRIVTVTSPYGLNARQAPGGDGEVIQVLDPDVTGVVIDETDEWVRIELESGEQLWVSSSEDLVEFSTQTVAVEPGDAPPVEESAPSEDAAAPSDQDVTVRIEAAAGVNARSEPSADAEVVTILQPDTTLTALALSDDGEWVQVSLDDGQTAWVFVDVVTVEGDPASLVEPAAETPTEAAVDETTAVTGTETVTETATVTDSVDAGAPQPDTLPVVTIDNLIGAVARSEPATTAEQAAFISGGVELPALGRSADGDWIQVELEDGGTGWVFIGAIALNVDVESLPVVEP